MLLKLESSTLSTMQALLTKGRTCFASCTLCSICLDPTHSTAFCIHLAVIEVPVGLSGTALWVSNLALSAVLSSMGDKAMLLCCLY